MPSSTLSHLPRVQPRRRGPLVAAVVAGAVAVIVAVVLVVALTGRGGSGPATDSAAPRLALPDQVAGYTHAVDADAGRVVDTFRTSISKANGADLSAEKAQLAVYRTPQAAAALFVLADTARDDAVLHRTLSSGRPAALALRLLSENQIDVSRTFPPGPGGGSLQCANGTVQPGVTTPVCVWASAHTFGELIDLTGKLDPGRLAAVTRTVRAAAERG